MKKLDNLTLYLAPRDICLFIEVHFGYNIVIYFFEFAIKEFDIIINTIKIRINSDDA